MVLTVLQTAVGCRTLAQGCECVWPGARCSYTQHQLSLETARPQSPASPRPATMSPLPALGGVLLLLQLAAAQVVLQKVPSEGS